MANRRIILDPHCNGMKGGGKREGVGKGNEKGLKGGEGSGRRK